MTKAEQDLLDLLSSINKMELRLRHLKANVAVPVIAYELIGRLRDEVAKWGIENIGEGSKK